MYEKGSVTASQRRESAGTVGKWPECLPLCLRFVVFATKTARRMIRFPDDKRALSSRSMAASCRFSACGVVEFCSSWGPDPTRRIPLPVHHALSGLSSQHDQLAPVRSQSHPSMPGVADGEAVTSEALLVQDVLRYPVQETLERLRAVEGKAVVEE